MDGLISWITAHAAHAHWIIFGALLLAGFNIPISADLLIIASALLAATIIPEHTIHLYLAIFLGCYASAAIAYWVGRLVGKKLQRWRFFAKLLSPERLEKVQKFYHRRGFWTLLVGRFIPFGVRNCIFMSTGMSRLSFKKFALWDLLACFLWSLSVFTLIYYLGHNTQYLKIFNLSLFSAFAVTLILFIWYKRKKKLRHVEPIQ
ncbi:MAG: DedA family protein [Verrucomicrobia bacterium]|nr:DedA family protein [Verrucomicrobiota bacterium]